MTARRPAMRMAVDGLTPSLSASVTSLVSPCPTTINMRNCGRVTRSSAAASDRADIATSTREAVSTAAVTASRSSPIGSSSASFAIGTVFTRSLPRPCQRPGDVRRARPRRGSRQESRPDEPP